MARTRGEEALMEKEVEKNVEEASSESNEAGEEDGVIVYHNIIWPNPRGIDLFFVLALQREMSNPSSVGTKVRVEGGDYLIRRAVEEGKGHALLSGGEVQLCGEKVAQMFHNISATRVVVKRETEECDNLILEVTNTSSLGLFTEAVTKYGKGGMICIFGRDSNVLHLYLSMLGSFADVHLVDVQTRPKDEIWYVFRITCDAS